MSGHGSRDQGRVVISLRMRRGARRAVDELRALLGDDDSPLSRDDMVHLLIRDGLAAWYERLGIQESTAVMAAKLLEVLEATWAAEMSDEELHAFAVTRLVLDRIAQIDARENRDAADTALEYGARP